MQLLTRDALTSIEKLFIMIINIAISLHKTILQTQQNRLIDKIDNNIDTIFLLYFTTGLY